MTPDQVAQYVAQHYSDHDVALILGEIEVESSFNAQAFRPDRNGGSYGLMQLDLPTARDRGYAGDGQGLYDPFVNMRFGVAQLDWIARFLRNHSAYSVSNMIAAYNEGVGNVLKGNPDPRYVQAVLNARTRWQLKLQGHPS